MPLSQIERSILNTREEILANARQISKILDIIIRRVPVYTVVILQSGSIAKVGVYSTKEEQRAVYQQFLDAHFIGDEEQYHYAVDHEHNTANVIQLDEYEIQRVV